VSCPCIYLEYMGVWLLLSCSRARTMQPELHLHQSLPWLYTTYIDRWLVTCVEAPRNPESEQGRNASTAAALCGPSSPRQSRNGLPLREACRPPRPMHAFQTPVDII